MENKGENYRLPNANCPPILPGVSLEHSWVVDPPDMIGLVIFTCHMWDSTNSYSMQCLKRSVCEHARMQSCRCKPLQPSDPLRHDWMESASANCEFRTTGFPPLSFASRVHLAGLGAHTPLCTLPVLGSRNKNWQMLQGPCHSRSIATCSGSPSTLGQGQAGRTVSPQSLHHR